MGGEAQQQQQTSKKDGGKGLSGDLDVVCLADLVVRCGGADAEHVVVLRLLRHRRRRRCCSLAKNTYYSGSKKQEASSGAWTEERGKEGGELRQMEGRKGAPLTHSWRSAGKEREPRPHRPIFPVMRTPRQQSWAEGRAARCARGVARQSHPAGRRGREFLKLMPYLQRAGRAARGGGGPATAKA